MKTRATHSRPPGPERPTEERTTAVVALVLAVQCVFQTAFGPTTAVEKSATDGNQAANG